MAFLKAFSLRGFKTFARPTELVFEPGVTVIIGPNGSGKSNLADAVLWALGEQSPGTLRGKAMQDVIFAGSDGHKASGAAEVRLLFENSGGAFPGGYAEVEITRRLLRDGTSHYVVNGVPRRLLDVQELCAAVGLGREMHSVISQGRVEELLNSSPAARRALVEEAAGLMLLKKRRERTATKLERVSADLARVGDIEHEVRNALRPLKQQVNAAQRHQELSERIARVEATLTLREIMELEAQQNRLTREVATVTERRQEAERELTQLRTSRENEERGFTQALAVREAQAATVNRIQSEARRLRERRDDLAQRIGRWEADLGRLERREAVDGADLANVQARLAALGHPEGWGVGRLAKVRSLGQQVTVELERLRPLAVRSREQEDAHKDRILDLEGARSRDRQKAELLEREIAELSRRRGHAQTKGVEAGEAVEVLRQELAVTLRRRDEAAAAAEPAAAAARAAAATAAAARQQLGEARAASRRAEERVATLEGRARIARQTAERREGLPDGARELLRTLGSAGLLVEHLDVRPGFERAVAAALGPLADAVLVEGRVSAELLAGTAGTMEVLAAVDGVWDGAGSRGAVDGPAGTEALGPEEPGPWSLWEVIGVPSGVRSVLMRLLPEVVVVRELREADAAADDSGRAGGRLVVTLSGELLRGEFHAARRVAAGPEALLRARRAVEELERELREARTALAEAQEAAVAAERTLGEAHAEREAREKAAAAARTEAAQLIEEAEGMERRLRDATEVAERLQTEGEHLVAAETSLREEAEYLRESVIEAERELQESRVVLAAEREQASRVRETVARLEEKRAQASVLEARLRERVRAHEAEHARVTGECSLLQGRLAGVRRRVQALRAALPAARDLLGVMEALAERGAGFAAQAEAQIQVSRQTTAGFADMLRRMADRESHLQRTLTDCSEEAVDLQVRLAHEQDALGDARERLGVLKQRHLSPRAVTAEEAGALDVDVAETKVEQLRRRLEALGPVNPLADREYRETAERLAFLEEQRKDLEDSLNELRRIIRDLDEHTTRVFSEFFTQTAANFAEMVAVLFPGGRGELRLEEAVEAEPGEPEEDTVDRGLRRPPAGVQIFIKLPQKAPRTLTLLSGGEKALAAIAFLFALFLARPCPFYILDEVEAALDDINIGRFLSLVRRYQDRTQFLIITHQRRTMEIADTLYGVTMGTDGVSRVLSRRLRSGAPETEARAG
ncbi:MAG: chromosome segregation protein SMC [Actinobacteria bacterium]|nr:chromosome segregation protein SMC [Actinomycetota bacterium]